jgi:quercetin dioxygenase-like cupin family protein
MPIRWIDELKWEDPPRGYYLADVKQKLLWKDEETGATWAMIKFPEGIADKRHTHPEANQYSFFLRGEVERGDNNVIELNGKVASIQEKGNPHGRTNFTKETIALFFWDGPPKPEVVE